MICRHKQKKRLITYEEAADQLGVKKETIRKYCCIDKLHPLRKEGWRPLLRQSEINAILKRRASDE